MFFRRSRVNSFFAFSATIFSPDLSAEERNPARKHPAAGERCRNLGRPRRPRNGQGVNDIKKKKFFVVVKAVLIALGSI